MRLVIWTELHQDFEVQLLDHPVTALADFQLSFAVLLMELALKATSVAKPNNFALNFTSAVSQLTVKKPYDLLGSIPCLDAVTLLQPPKFLATSNRVSPGIGSNRSSLTMSWIKWSIIK